MWFDDICKVVGNLRFGKLPSKDSEDFGKKERGEETKRSLLCVHVFSRLEVCRFLPKYIFHRLVDRGKIVLPV